MRGRRIVIVMVAAATLLAACGSDSPSTGASGAGASTTSPAKTPAAGGGGAYGPAPSTGKAATGTSTSTVSVAHSDSFGDILVGPNGKTLYVFDKDSGTTTACTGGCVPTWPPLTAASQPTGGPGVNADELSTADGAAPDQVVYHGHLLYYFAGDAGPGDVNGVKIPAWYPVSPSGEKIDRD